MDKNEYDKNYVMTKCRQVTLLLNKEHDADIIQHLDSLSNKNGYLKGLIRKDMKIMRNEQILQNYAPSLFRISLCGKETNTIRITKEMKTKEYWQELFTEAIEDLEAGCRINGKGEKNSVDYWQRQIRLLNEFEPNEKG